MKIYFKYRQLLFPILLATISSCHSPLEDKADNVEDLRTPVTVTTISRGPLGEYIELSATSAYLLKSFVKANTNGYIQSMNIRLGMHINSGQFLCSIKTKESQSIGNAVSILDSTFKFTGVNTIKANGSGYITQLDHQNGDYVLDGEQLAVISSSSSFVFLLNLPYELSPYIANRKIVQLVLPDGSLLTGIVSSTMPTLDSVSQTQSVIIKVNPSHDLPENLIAKAKILKFFKPNVTSLPKTAILTDEAQTNFWIMKMVDSSTAVKVEIKKGMETEGKVEIISPPFSSSDKILLTGNYGLPDTAKVKIMLP